MPHKRRWGPYSAVLANAILYKAQTGQMAQAKLVLRAIGNTAFMEATLADLAARANAGSPPSPWAFSATPGTLRCATSPPPTTATGSGGMP